MTDRFATADVVLAAAVANGGTFTVSYPSGTSQQSFDTGLKGPGSYAILNSNDKFTEAAGKISISYGASNITVTNNSGFSWPAGTKVSLNFDRQDGNDIVIVAIPVKLAKITGAGDIVSNLRLGIAGWLEAFSFLVTDPVTTAAKAATLTPKIDTTGTTGGAIALTSAAATPLGTVIQSTDFTANNKLVPESKLSITASAVTAFAEGEGILHLRIRKDPAYA
jgi:fructose-specific phosphotransferase system component IIB